LPVVCPSWFHRAHHSFSQSGEDLIIQFLFDWVLGIPSPTYLDIGAHHPTYLSNTYLFYRRGCRGVLVEPDPDLFRVIAAKRKRDVCLNEGIGVGEAREADFFVMSASTLNTFVREEAERIAAAGRHRIEKVIRIPLRPVNELIEQHFSGPPDFVSLDVEGLDHEILASLDFARFGPRVLCVETLTYSDDKTERKLTEIVELVKARGYRTYADTHINTIFVSDEAWRARRA
jgi:FkbM family methyltransferase